jgi:hypothetical protein
MSTAPERPAPGAGGRRAPIREIVLYIGERPRRGAGLGEDDVDPIGMALGMPIEDLAQGSEMTRLAHRDRGCRHRDEDRLAGRGDALPRENRGEEVTRRFGFDENALGQRHAESALDARDQFRPAETVDAELAVEPAVEPC